MAKLETPKAQLTTSLPQGGPPQLASKVFVEWSAPLRPFRPLNKENFRRLVIWSIVLGLVLIFFREFVLTLTIFALLFFSYVMGTVPPQTVTHQINGKGISVAGHTYHWNELGGYYFIERLGMPVLILETASRRHRVALVLQGVVRSEIEAVLQEYLPHREDVPKSFSNNLTERVAQLLNLA